jgi:outer membrane biosynthesis protein TonB
MRFGWIGSVVAHGLMLMLMVVAWPHDEPDLPPASTVVPIDIIDSISDVTNISAIAPEPLEDAPEADELAPVGAPHEITPPEPDAPEAIADPKVKQKQKETPRRPTTDLRSLQAMIDLEKRNEGNNGGPRPNAPTGPNPRDAVGAGAAATASEADAIQAHVQRCWRAPADLPYPERLIVKVRIRLNADGSLAAQPELVSPRSLVGLDPATRVAAENALRAVRVCEPFPMRPNRTERVSAVLNFDPRRMAGAY